MRLWSYRCFVPAVSLIFLLVASYSLLGLILNFIWLEKSNFHGVWPLNERCGIIVLMVAQCVLLLVAAIGFGGVLLRSVLIWYIPGFFLMGIGVTLVSFAGVTLRESSRNFNHDIISAGRKAMGTKAEALLDWISGIQWEYDCCGIFSYKDYLQFRFPNLASESVPKSCCLRNIKIPTQDCGLGVLRPHNPVEKIQATIMANGCGRIMSELHGAVLRRLGVELLVVGLLSLVIAAFIYIGVFKIVTTELNHFDDHEGEPSQVERDHSLSETTISSTTAANTYSNAANGSRSPANRRRIFRTRRHGGGESIVSFAVDIANNNLSQNATSIPQSHQKVGQGRGKRNQVRCQGSRNIKKGQSGKGQGRNRSAGGVRLPVEDKGFVNTSTMEMLFKTRDNNSILSTTSNQSFITYFRENQKRKPSDPSDVSIGQPVVPTHVNNPWPTLTHYSSLPHVNKPSPSPTLMKNPDLKSKAMAELKQRFPPGMPIVGPRSKSPNRQSEDGSNLPPVSSETQHLHYYRIQSNAEKILATVPVPPQQVSVSPPPIFIDGKFPSVACESVLDTIQEEAEGSRSTVPPPEQVNRVSIFEIFGNLESSSNLEAETASAPNINDPAPASDQHQHLDNEESSGSLPVGPGGGEILEPNFLNIVNDNYDREHGAGCLIISEDLEMAIEVTLESLEKERMDPELEGLVYNQV